MKNVEPLLNHAITAEVLKQGATATRVDIASYLVGAIGPTSNFLRSFDRFRLIMGYFDKKDLVRCHAFVSHFRPNWVEQSEFRLLHNSHVKLYVFHGQSITAIVGSSNILSRAYEAAVLVRGKLAKFFASAFEELWRRSIQVKPLDLEAAKESSRGWCL